MPTVEQDPLLVFERGPAPAGRRTWLKRLGFLLLFFLLAGGAALGFGVWGALRQSQTPAGFHPAAIADITGLTGSSAVKQDGTTPTVGPANAKVVVVEFSDFQCPYCAQVAPVVDELIKKYSRQVLFVYRDFPIAEIHPQALGAAMAGKCAQEQGKFWQLHDLLFQNQENFTEVTFKSLAVRAGLDSLAFSSCFTTGKYLEAIKKDFNDGVAAGVEATPTFFINGVKLEGARPIGDFEQVIESALVAGR